MRCIWIIKGWCPVYGAGQINSNMRCIWMVKIYIGTHFPDEINSNMRCIWIILFAGLEHLIPAINSNMRCIWISKIKKQEFGNDWLIVTWDVFEFPVARDTPKSVKD